MLIDEPSVFGTNPIYSLIAIVNGRDPAVIELQRGVYMIGHFGGSSFLAEYEHYPILSVGPYGVCDSVEQLLEACPELEAPGREFVVTVHCVDKAEQPEEGGWRWHKWGEYIGDQEPECEYLYDEPVIERVWCYHIYEKK